MVGILCWGWLRTFVGAVVGKAVGIMRARARRKKQFDGLERFLNRPLIDLYYASANQTIG
jgi:hypothetical protein